ncbi:hypothetical protein F4553_004285 [Allocatelliglobosispora scoriae]|uniref:G domain-containing protein n=1 Tax=Allocatelliglobosispora scoriae TaxID=643052 RepID=A0A841BTZ7_9ACTN|nr:GTPase domain-containing protein [Allocatelliglobosispora scoriae]MBB5870906.1 hypothetical protein [Allocatelliglobosispora scoriae]
MTSSSSVRPPAPLLAVVGGPTGAGKSTLVNSLVRAPVSPVGVLRPTTRTPVLICNPADTARVHRHGLRPIGASLLPLGIAVIDAPDMDSIEEANRPVAEELFAAADLWLFVITATRYADAAAWRHLEVARARGVALAVVLDRVPVESAPEIARHLRELLGEPAPPLFVVPESRLDRQGMLPEKVIAPLRDWLAAVVAGPPAEPEWADEPASTWEPTDWLAPTPPAPFDLSTEPVESGRAEPSLVDDLELPTEPESPTEDGPWGEDESAVEPEAVEPEAIDPEAIEPEAIEPEAIEPEAIEPEAVEPESGVAAETVDRGDGRASARTRNASGRYMAERPAGTASTRPEAAEPVSDEELPDTATPEETIEVTAAAAADGTDDATNPTLDGLDDPTPVGETVDGKSRPTPQPVGAGGPSEGPPTDPGGQA